MSGRFSRGTLNPTELLQVGDLVSAEAFLDKGCKRLGRSGGRRSTTDSFGQKNRRETTPSHTAPRGTRKGVWRNREQSHKPVVLCFTWNARRQSRSCEPAALVVDTIETDQMSALRQTSLKLAMSQASQFENLDRSVWFHVKHVNVDAPTMSTDFGAGLLLIYLQNDVAHLSGRKSQ